jgi:CubicO group peptidase (beta-lactamase class C family)
MDAAPAAPDEVTRLLRGVRNRHACVGMAVAVVRSGRAEFVAHGLADIGAERSVTPDTVFRIASLTKLFTAVAVMQLHERGGLDLDAPANDYLRAYRLVPGRADFPPVTVRHLLTHTSGIPDVVRLQDLLHPGWGAFGMRPACASVAVGEPMPPLAAYYRDGLRSVVEPGTVFAYTNHGFATLGQIVEDVTGQPLDRYLREWIFEPLGMTDTDLRRERRLEARRATGHDVGGRGAVPVVDREWLTRGASGVYSTSRDMARFVAALLGGGRNGDGSILAGDTLATMFAPQFQPDPRLPGMGLGFFRSEVGGHRVVGHDGRMPGFNAQLLVAPDDGVGVIGLTNGAPGATYWLGVELETVIQRLLDLPDPAIRTDLPQRPDVWADVSGRYELPPRISDLRGRLAMGGGLEVTARGGRLVARLRIPVPAALRGIPLHPDDETDPYLFRVDLSALGMPMARVAFGRDAAGRRVVHTDLGMVSLSERRGRRSWPAAILAAAAIGGGILAARHRRATATRRG